MSANEMSVDEIVAALGKAMATGHLPEELSSTLAVLIADWRKRGAARDLIENELDVLSASHKDLAHRVARMGAVLKGLVDRLDEIHEDSTYKSVWMVNQIHAGPYTGPTYIEALANARAALPQSAESGSEK